jgi:hypothetical protein
MFPGGLVLAAAAMAAPPLKECQTIYLHPMPESLDEFDRGRPLAGRV